MASGNDVVSKLLLSIEANTSSLTKGLNEAKSKLNSFSSFAGKIGGVVAGAFAVGSVIDFGKRVFEMAQQFDDIIGKIDDLGNSINLALDAGRAKAIADTFGTDIDKVIQAANATAKQFGVSFSEALQMVQKGISLAGPQTEKYLKAIENNAAAYSAAGGSADQFFYIVTNGYRNATEYEKQLKQGAEGTAHQFKDLTDQMNDGQLIQQRLIDSSADLNSIWAETFDGTGDLVDELKISFNEIASDSLRAIKKATVDIINYVIDLYNESIYFRFIVQQVVFYWKEVWEIIKLVGRSFVTVFKSAGDLVSALLKGEFSKIPQIYADAVKDQFSNFVAFGSETAENFKDSVEAVLLHKPIKLIGEGEAENQGKKAAKDFDRGFTGQELKLQIIKPGKPAEEYKPLTDADLGAPGKLVTGIQQATESTNMLRSAWEGFDGQMNKTLSETFANGLLTAGEALAGFGESASQSFAGIVSSILEGLRKVIFGLLQTAISGMIAGESKRGILGLATAAIGIGAITAMFNSKVKKFALGGTVNGGVGGSSLITVGEHGRELLSVPNGSRVTNNFETERLFAGSRQPVMLQAKLYGEDIYLSYNEAARRRGKSI